MKDYTENDKRASFGYITITVPEYNKLKADQQKLNNLEAAGVDNWEGYSFAFEDDEDEN